MSAPQDDLDDDRLLIVRCQEGDSEAVGRIRDKCHRNLSRILLARGASPTEIDDLLADLWADCTGSEHYFPGQDFILQFRTLFSSHKHLGLGASTVTPR